MAEYDEAVRRPPGDLQAEPNMDVSVIGLPGRCLGEADGLLARCFHANPNFVDLFPNERARSRALPRMFAAGLRDTLGLGHVYAAMRGAETSLAEVLVGVAWTMIRHPARDQEAGGPDGAWSGETGGGASEPRCDSERPKNVQREGTTRAEVEER